jgi:hypothetical protein
MRAALAGNKAGEVEELQDLNVLFQTADVGIGREANAPVAGWDKPECAEADE